MAAENDADLHQDEAHHHDVIQETNEAEYGLGHQIKRYYGVKDTKQHAEADT